MVNSVRFPNLHVIPEEDPTGGVGVSLTGSGDITLTPSPTTGTGVVGRSHIGFQVEKTATNTVFVANTLQKIVFNTVDWDTNSWWDAANNQYKPQLAGYWLFIAAFNYQYVLLGAPNDQGQVQIRFNGLIAVPTRAVALSISAVTGGNIIQGVAHCSTLMKMNGTTDFVQSWGELLNGGTVAPVAQSIYFTGAWMGS